jgi:hypothetical protein
MQLPPEYSDLLSFAAIRSRCIMGDVYRLANTMRSTKTRTAGAHDRYGRFIRQIIDYGLRQASPRRSEDSERAGCNPRRFLTCQQ